MHDYGELTLADADHTARFIAGCYAAFPRFDEFTAYSMFYFAAASYSELARRLGVQLQPERARFLCADRAGFADATRRLSPAEGPRSGDYGRDVANAIAPLNIAGLCDPAKRNWYGIDFGDAIGGASKFGVSAKEVVNVLAAAGVVRPT